VILRTERLELPVEGDAGVHDLTPELRRLVGEHGLHEGQVTVFAVGSTAAVTAIEFEPGLVRDLPELLDRLVPPGRYHHDATWHDGNGHAHLRAALLGPSLTVPVTGGELVLGTCQQVVVNLDVRPRRREVVVQLVGEPAAGRGA